LIAVCDWIARTNLQTLQDFTPWIPPIPPHDVSYIPDSLGSAPARRVIPATPVHLALHEGPARPFLGCTYGSRMSSKSLEERRRPGREGRGPTDRSV